MHRANADVVSECESWASKLPLTGVASQQATDQRTHPTTAISLVVAPASLLHQAALGLKRAMTEGETPSGGSAMLLGMAQGDAQ